MTEAGRSVTTVEMLNTHDRARVAVSAVVSTRSVERYLAGVALRDNTRVRIEKALRSLGLSAALKAQPTSPQDA